ncbi:MAG: ANTAR domain-containing protein [Oscillospiraceae bacterium]|nr:ANTAR domain-containing protein [Oscillospiraceae bacterium]MCR4759896.1 ANTAR domain-containing protein [Oscillospiraceae bacterium]
MLTRFEQKEVFVISSNENFYRYVRENLPDGDFTVSGCADSCTEARQKMMDTRSAVILINIPLADESGTELAGDLAENTAASVIAVVKNDQETEFRQSLEPAGIFVLGRPFPHSSFHQALYDAASAYARMQIMSQENQRLQIKLIDLRIVNRAKYALIQYLGMTEEQAHKYIEQQAMNQRISKRKAAENIIKTYENH